MLSPGYLSTHVSMCECLIQTGWPSCLASSCLLISVTQHLSLQAWS